MQYNKYALALVLLASSAYAVDLPKFENISSVIFNKDVSVDRDAYVAENAKFVPTDKIADLLNETDQAKIVTDLKEFYYDSTAKAIIGRLDSSTSQISSVEYNHFKDFLEQTQFDKIKEYEEITSKSLSHENLKELKMFLEMGTLPEITVAERVATILNLASGLDRLSLIPDFKKTALPKQIEVIKLSEDLKGVKLDDAVLEEILQIVDDGALDAKIATLLSEVDQANAAKLNEIVATINASLNDGQKFNDIADVSKLDLTPEQLSALKFINPVKNDINILEILRNPGNAELNENVKKILALTDDDKKISESDELKTLVKEEKKIAAIKYQEDEVLKKKITEEVLRNILNANDEALNEFSKPEDKPQDSNVDEKNKSSKALEESETALVALAEKIKAAIPDNKSFDQMVEADIIKLGLTDEQIDALKKAKATKTSDIADILKKPKVPVNTTTAPDTVNGTSGASDITEETPFYKSKLFMGAVVVLVVASIGGGVYMMTRKSDETDL